MNESVNTELTSTPSLSEPREAMKLTGLRPILNARRIERKVMARQIDFDLNRFLNIVGASSRATPEEIDKIAQTLNVSIEQLLEPDLTPPRRRSPNATSNNNNNNNITFADEPYDDDEAFEHAEPAALPQGDVVLNIALPDGRKYSVGSNQSLSGAMLQRMSQALAILAGTD